VLLRTSVGHTLKFTSGGWPQLKRRKEIKKTVPKVEGKRNIVIKQEELPQENDCREASSKVPRPSIANK
jgi:hypothetical protein